MGQSSLILRPDNKILDLDKEFPSRFKTVGLAMSGGVESAALLLLLIERYGKENVHVFSGIIHGRRSWEARNAEKLCKMIGVSNFHAIDKDFRFMGNEDNGKLRLTGLSLVPSIEGWFNGANKLLFAPTNVTTQEQLDVINKRNVFIPFIQLLKHHTIDILYQLGREDVLYETFSCTERSDRHCGVCYCCHERVRGFATIGEKDKATYNVEWSDILNECFYSDKHIVKNW